MSAELTTVLVAVLGVCGTLLSPILVQQIASRAKRLEFDLQRQQQLDERRESRRQQALDERRAMYAAFNTAARRYTQALRAYLRAIYNGEVSDEDKALLAGARQSYRDLYSDAQMVFPDEVLAVASSVNTALGDTYGKARRLESGRSAADAGPTGKDIEEAQEYCRVQLYELIGDMRQVMREDLGVAGEGGKLPPPENSSEGLSRGTNMRTLRPEPERLPRNGPVSFPPTVATDMLNCQLGETERS